MRDELHGKTILGVSNISFGLPQREIINAAFFTMAMQNGLSAAIINPNSDAMMRSYYSFRALSDLDPQCGDYIAAYGGAVQGTGIASPLTGAAAAKNAGTSGGGKTEQGLAESIVRGLKERAIEAVKELLGIKDSLAIINEEMIPALDQVGKGFEKGTVFLPQLLMSAEAAKAAFEVIKDQMQKSGQTQEKKGTIILATVKGDIHDIGKNIVKVLLENYSFEIIDLGKDVPQAKILETAKEHHAEFIALSALMTTTMQRMREIVAAAKQEGITAKIIIGGAVITQEYADEIGADGYSKDAADAVKLAKSLME